MDRVFEMEDGLLLLDYFLLVESLRTIAFFEFREGCHGRVIC